MKRFLILILLLHTASIFGQEVPLPGESLNEDQSENNIGDLSGHIENTTTAYSNETQEQTDLLNNTRARINLEGRPNKNTDYALSLSGSLYSGADRYQLLDYFPEKQRNEAALQEAYIYTYENEIVLQEAFGSLYFDDIMVRLGRQKFYTGTGYAYNPSDLFNTKNPVDPSYELDGLDALLISVPLPYNFSLDTLLRAGETPQKSDLCLYAAGYAGSWSFGAQYSSVYREVTDYESFNRVDAESAVMTGNTEALDPSTYLRYSRWHYTGLEFSGDVSGIHIYGEGGYVTAEKNSSPGLHETIDRNHERILIGCDYTFEMQLYLIAEYLRYGPGNSSAEDISFTDRIEYYTGEHLSLAKNTLFTGASYPVTDLSELGIYTIYEIDVQSVMINPQYTYDIAEGAELSVNGQFPAGRKKAVGSSGPGGFVRVKFSF